MKRILTLLCLVFFIEASFAQAPLQVLFLGDSLTSYNNLPVHLEALAINAGKNLYCEMYAPGQYTLGMHLDDEESMYAIALRDWDYVVLQEESAIPLIPLWYESDMKHHVAIFNRLLNEKCITPVLYLPPAIGPSYYPCSICDDALEYCSDNFDNFDQWVDYAAKSYSGVSDLYKIPMIPAGLAWKTPVAQNRSGMFDAEDILPGPKGQYLNACVFYTFLLNIPVSGNNYHGACTPQEAAFFQSLADGFRQIYQDSFNLPLLRPSPPDFHTAQNFLEVEFTPVYTGRRPAKFKWLFGDGETSMLRDPVHHYTEAGNYEVKLIIDDSCNKDTVTKEIEVTEDHTALNEIDQALPVKVYPNPASSVLYVSNVKKNSTIRLYDLKGQMLIEKDNATGNEEMQLDLSSLVAGYYLIAVIDEDGVTHFQITKAE